MKKRLVIPTGAIRDGIKPLRDSDSEGHNVQDVANRRFYKKSSLVLDFITKGEDN
jgi:hypothetical protein